jgi:hypothetical protein
MALFHHITVFGISEQEKADFLEAGVEFREITLGPRGECAIFEIQEGDPRWNKVFAVIEALQECGDIPKKYRIKNLSMTAPMDELMRQLKERTAAVKRSQPGPKWLDGYSGQSADELLSLEGKYRTDSLVLAFEQAINSKTEQKGFQTLSDEEQIVLAVEALEREVNNGGYDQFFVNSSREFVATVVRAHQRIGCKKTAIITQRAIKALDVADLTSEAIEAAMAAEDQQRLAKLSRCDDSYYKSAEPIAERLFAFIKANKAAIRF